MLNKTDTMNIYRCRVIAQFILIFIGFFILTSGYSQVKSKWQFKTEGRVIGTPVVENHHIYIGSTDQKLYALDLQSGMKKWTYLTGGEVRSSPVLSRNFILCASADGNLYALDKENGKQVWTFKSEGEKNYGLWDYYLSSPKVHENIVYWGSGDGHIYALKLDTGNLIWKFKTGDIVHADPVIHEDKIFIGSFDGHLYALNKTNGALIWKFDTLGAQYFPKGEIQKSVLVDEGTVYFGSRDYNLYALNENDGKVKWNLREPAGWIIATPAVDGDHIFFGTSDAHKFYGVNKYSGMILWELPLNMRVYGSAVIHDDMVYFGTFDGKVIGADKMTGEVKWEFQTDGSKINYANVFNKQGEFKEGFTLYGTDVVESEKQILDLGAVLGTPVIDQNTIYFGSSDGYLYAVELPR